MIIQRDRDFVLNVDNGHEFNRTDGPWNIIIELFDNSLCVSMNSLGSLKNKYSFYWGRVKCGRHGNPFCLYNSKYNKNMYLSLKGFYNIRRRPERKI